MFEFLRRRAPAAIADETSMTPLEAAANPQVWREMFRTQRLPPKRKIKRFKRSTLHANVALYSADAGAKTLIVGFCGKRMRLMMPIATMLQFLDDRQYDVLVLSDPLKLYFDAGIGGYAGSLPELAKRISAIARQRGYSSLITYGTSMGGFPALRMGGLLGADRAISAGGGPVWHVSRLARKEPTIKAFDLICDCRMPLGTPCYALFSDGNPDDVAAAAKLAVVMPQSRLASLASASHNFSYTIFRKGRLEEYHQEIFGLGRDPDLERLAALPA